MAEADGSGLSAGDMAALAAAKAAVDRALADLTATGTAPPLVAPDCAFHLVHPLNDVAGTNAAVAAFWGPLRASLMDVQRTATILAAGRFAGRDYVATMGHYSGVFAHDFLGIPATGRPAWLRFAEIHRMDGGRVAECWMIVDLLDLMRQAGVWPLVPSLGSEGMWPGPGGGGGISAGVDTVGGAASLALVLAMHGGILQFDGRSLASMDHARYWRPDFAWYGPAGIGTTFGLAGFEAHHQIPFLRAFPDRRGGQHIARIGDGAFAVTGGWPSVTATHSGDGFLGLGATGRPVGMRVMDFYRCEAGLIAENWVPIDMVHLLGQMGYDVLARLAHLRGQPVREL